MCSTEYMPNPRGLESWESLIGRKVIITHGKFAGAQGKVLRPRYLTGDLGLVVQGVVRDFCVEPDHFGRRWRLVDYLEARESCEDMIGVRIRVINDPIMPHGTEGVIEWHEPERHVVGVRFASECSWHLKRGCVHEQYLADAPLSFILY